MHQQAILILIAASAVVLVGSMYTVMFAAAAPVKITTDEGLTLEEVLAAFEAEATREGKGVRDILVFSKSGGSLEAGNFQQNLRIDSQVEISPKDKAISFQYFVDVNNDLTGSATKHCSDIRLHIFVDHKEVYLTNWLGYVGRDPSLPLQTEKITAEGLSPGDHLLGLVPEGRESGCNVQGYVLSWGGTVVIFK